VKSLTCTLSKVAGFCFVHLDLNNTAGDMNAPDSDPGEKIHRR